MAAERHPFNPLTWSDQQISAACWGKFSGRSYRSVLAALQSHSISHFPPHIPTGPAGKLKVTARQRAGRQGPDQGELWLGRAAEPKASSSNESRD
ncbi:hypothetical protein Q5P01_010157 [Channa striata]|uniref:Uncharacterized protein n=1 Tax=Channa striata TaxID=64152 RepID=A0AA88N0X8_CHASR|nr:hypothetical protein Q5P01_010157 [Channa striata]